MPAMERNPTSRPSVVAVVPIGTLEGAKSRLGETLDAEERRDLVTRLIRRTIETTTATPGIDETIVITPDDDVRRLALELGARPIRQRGQGLNQGLREGRTEVISAGADALLVLPIDLPLVSRDALTTLLAELDDPHRPLVVLVPDRHGRGTNALLLAPPDAIEFCFGGDSRAAHLDCARSRGVRMVEADGPLTLDLDTPADLLAFESLAPEVVVGETADAH
jgi:2-phospho-L-lactate guanylyltransferase